MRITILSVTKEQGTSKAGKPYPFLELAFKGEDGKVSGKKVMPFGDSKPVFEALDGASSGTVFNITSIKNESTGYWDWTAASKSDGTEAVTPTQGASSYTAKPGGKVLGNTYETPEERAKKQVYIVRQSSITAALGFLNNKAKSTSEVIQLAKEFEAYVLDTGEIAKPAAIQSLMDMSDDVPL